MKENFIVTILFFFLAMVTSGILGEKLKRNTKKKIGVFVSISSIVAGVFLIMPVYKSIGIKQILLFTVLIFLLNFGFIILLPEKEVRKK